VNWLTSSGPAGAARRVALVVALLALAALVLAPPAGVRTDDLPFVDDSDGGESRPSSLQILAAALPARPAVLTEPGPSGHATPRASTLSAGPVLPRTLPSRDPPRG